MPLSLQVDLNFSIFWTVTALTAVFSPSTSIRLLIARESNRKVAGER